MKRLKEIRKERKITAKQLAKVLNVSESTISLYENGKREPDLKTLLNIAEYFNVSVDYLIGKTDEKEKLIKDIGTISIRGRDGSVIESELSDSQLETFKKLLNYISDNDKK